MNRKIFLAAALALTMAGCQQQAQAETYDIKADTEAMSKEIDSLMNTPGMTEEVAMQKYQQILENYYQRHTTDSFGMQIFTSLAAQVWDAKQLRAEYDKADTLIKNNSRIKKYMQLAEGKEKTEVGCQYVDIKGPNALTGEELSISKTLEGGKMVLLDFWASWCGPCKRCIKNELPGVAEKYADKLQILGIDVWERQREDLDKIMPELPITWPVIYTGTGSESPADWYGVTGIPTLVLISPDGKILARGQMPEIMKVLEP